MAAKKSILVVDDEPIILMSAERILKPEGYAVDGVLSGKDALNKLEQNNYDLVLTDIRMSGIDGISLIRCIKQFRPSQGIVVITGYPLPETIKEALKLGIIDHMMKPFTPEKLKDVVSGAIERMKEKVTEKELKEEFPSSLLAELDKLINQYRKKPGSVIPVLLRAQELFGYLPASIQERIARGLNVYPAEIRSIVSFHSCFRTKPRGDHTIRVCCGTACYIKGSERVLSKIKETLKIGVGETTTDRKFTLEAVPCLGPCRLAPLMVIDQDLHGALTQGNAMHSINQYSPLRASALPEEEGGVRRKEKYV